MSDVIRVKFGMRWRYPVNVVRADGKFVHIHGPEEAVSFLIHQADTGGTGRFDKAHRTCVEALRGETAVEQARARFSDACWSAGILLA